jgi:ABC-type oligopeptide transport system, ATPase component
MLLQVSHLRKFFAVRKNLYSKPLYVKAVDDCSFSIQRNTVFGVVGESGSGKTTLGRVLLRLIEATSGSVLFDNTDILSLNTQELGFSGAECRSFRRTLIILSTPEKW